MPPKVDKIEAEIRKLAKLEGNKTCADCPEKVPGYVDLTHNVFVCTRCSGIHREFQFKIKGVSMAVFTAEDVAGMSSMGNDHFNSIYLARLNSREYVLPNGNDINKLKEFIKLKYVDKRWHRDSGSASSASPASAPAPAPASTPMERRQSVATPTHTPENPVEIASSSSPMPANDLSTNKIAIKLNRPGGGVNRRASTGMVDLPPKKTQDLTSGMNLMSLSDNSSNGAFDPFGQAPANKPTTANNTDPFASPTKTAGGFDAFGSDSSSSFDAFAEPPAVTNKSPPSNKSNNATFDAFAPQPSSSFDPFNNHPVAPSGGGFDAFNTPAKPQQPSGQSAYIKLNPPAPAPAATTATASAAASSAATKDFGAFDDLVNTSQAPASVNANPFDSHAPPAQTAQNTQMPGQYPTYPHMAPQGYPQPPQGYPQAPQGYPQPVPGSAPAGYGYAYPPGPYAPHPAYNYAAPPAPAGYYGYPPAQPAYGGPAPYNPAQPPVYSAPATNPTTAVPTPAATPDPFAAMSSLAWSAAGRSAPTNSGTTNAVSNPNPSYTTPPPATTPAPTPTPVTANPFDLF